MTTATAAKRLRYCEATLAQSISAARRQEIEAKAVVFRQHLAGHCARCGRSIHASDSVAQGLGPVCAHK